MAMAYAFQDGGTFTLAGSPVLGVNVQCNGVPDYIICKSLPDYAAGADVNNGTGWGATSNSSSIQWEWEKSMGNGYAFGILQTTSAAVPQVPTMSSIRLPLLGNLAKDAISSYDTSNPPVYASLAGTVLASNGAWTLLMSNTGTIQVGDYVRLSSPVGVAQLGGYSFQVTAVTVNTSITLGYALSSGLLTAAPTTTVNVIKYIPGRFYPRERRVLFITLNNTGNTTKIWFGQTNDFTVGENVYIRVPTKITRSNGGWGSQELNNQVGTVTAVINTATESSIVVSINSSGYSAFQFPTNAVGLAGISPAVVGPSSSGVVPNQQPPGTNLLDSFDNRNVNLIRFGSALFNIAGYTSTAADVWMWQSFKYDSYSNATITL